MLGVLMSEPWNPTSFHPRSSATMYTMLGLAPAAGALEGPAGCASAGALATQIPDATSAAIIACATPRTILAASRLIYLPVSSFDVHLGRRPQLSVLTARAGSSLEPSRRSEIGAAAMLLKLSDLAGARSCRPFGLLDRPAQLRLISGPTAAFADS